MKKQRYNCRFMGFNRNVYERLRDLGVSHSSMLVLKDNPVKFLQNTQVYLKDVPTGLISECIDVVRNLLGNN